MPHCHGQDLRKGRVSIPGQIYLVTTVTHKRQPLFHDFHTGRIVVDSLRQLEQRYRVGSMAFVVMPDHLHWLFSLGDTFNLSQVIGNLKRCSAYRINRRCGRAGMPVWQRGFHDYALRKDEDIFHVARYIVANPLRAGLVSRIGDYPLWDAKWL
jgi:REP-associated tyrosine transposase